jgi:flagellar biosynthetic protein FlhB
MPDQSGEKTQDPTPHRRQQARNEGNVARSQDLTSAVLLIAGVAALLTLGGTLVEFLADFAQRQIGGQAWLHADSTLVVAQWNGMILELSKRLLPILGVLMLTAIVVNLAQVGFLFLPEKVGFDIARLDILKAFGRIFSLDGVVRLGFGLFKIAVIATVAAICLWKERTVVVELVGQTLPVVAAYLAQTVLWISMKVGVALLILAVFDFGYQYWRHEQDLKMTPQEVREELRNLEGDPQIVARRRAVQRQLVMNRLSSAVPKADVVITNPTELAIAIQYNPEKMAAPVVVAKGAGVVAQRIRRLALENGIPIIEKKPLAQALYREVDVNQPIPQDKYAAVAEVLAFVYHLKGKKFRPQGPSNSRAA